MKLPRSNSRLPKALVTSDGITRVLDSPEEANVVRPSTCLFIISKLTAGWPSSLIAFPTTLVCSASASALIFIAYASASAVILTAYAIFSASYN